MFLLCLLCLYFFPVMSDDSENKNLTPNEPMTNTSDLITTKLLTQQNVSLLSDMTSITTSMSIDSFGKTAVKSDTLPQDGGIHVKEVAVDLSEDSVDSTQLSGGSINSTQNDISEIISETLSTSEPHRGDPVHLITPTTITSPPPPSLPPLPIPIKERFIILEKPKPKVFQIEFGHQVTILHPSWMGHYLIKCNPVFSCAQRCGEVTRPRTRKYKCSCDKMCKYYGDCCQDYFSGCESLYSNEDVELFLNSRLAFSQEGSTVENEDYADVVVSTYGTCKSMDLYVDGYLKDLPMWFVNKCPDNFHEIQGFDVKQSCEGRPPKELFSFPVSHRWNPRVVYKNIYCAFCHGVGIQDIQFWNVQVRCSALKTSNSWEIDDLIDLVESDGECGDHMTAALPANVILRSCEEVSEVRCPDESKNGDQKTNTHQEILDAQLCDSYIRPLHHKDVVYTNIHCLACHNYSQAVEEDLALTFCPYSFHSGRAFLNTEYVVDVSFKNGRFHVYRKHQKSNVLDETIESVRHKDCFNVQVDARLNFLDHCSQDCTDAKFPSKHFEGSEMICSLSKYMYQGDHPSFRSTTPGFNVEISLTFSNELQTDQLATVFKGIGEAFSKILTKYTDNESDNKLQDLRFQRTSNESTVDITLSWTFHDRAVTALRLAALVDKEMRLEFKRTFATSRSGEQMEVVKRFEVSKVRSDKLVCSSNKMVKMRNMDITSYRHLQLVFISNYSCVLNLETVLFKTHYNGDGTIPTSVDNLYLCQEPELEAMCGPLLQWSKDPNVRTDESKMPPARQSETVTIQPDLNDIKKNRSTAPSDSSPNINDPNTDFRTDFDHVQDDLQTFQNVCIYICIFGQIVKIISVIHELRSVKPEARSVFIFLRITRVISSTVLIVLMALFLISHEASGLDHFSMGVASHCCWLLLTGITFINTMKSSKGVKFSRLRKMTQFVLLVILAVILTYGIIEKDDAIHAQIGYSHQTKHIFWISDRVACTIGLIVLCATFFLASFCIQIATFFRQKADNSGDVEDPPDKIVKREKVVVYSDFKWDIFILALFLTGAVDYSQDENHLWKLIFNLVTCCLGLWDIGLEGASWQFPVHRIQEYFSKDSDID